MKTIWKFPLSVRVAQSIKIPACPEFLTIQHQGRDPRDFVLWAVVDTDMPTVELDIDCYGTGHELPHNPGRYIATVQAGLLVWHYFARNYV